ncbi:hypothetical protein B0H17DRAFT_298205, partial [Mycena rosella]
MQEIKKIEIKLRTEIQRYYTYCFLLLVTRRISIRRRARLGGAPQQQQQRSSPHAPAREHHLRLLVLHRCVRHGADNRGRDLLRSRRQRARVCLLARMAASPARRGSGRAVALEAEEEKATGGVHPSRRQARADNSRVRIRARRTHTQVALEARHGGRNGGCACLRARRARWRVAVGGVTVVETAGSVGGLGGAASRRSTRALSRTASVTAGGRVVTRGGGGAEGIAGSGGATSSALSSTMGGGASAHRWPWGLRAVSGSMGGLRPRRDALVENARGARPREWPWRRGGR